MKNPLWNLAIGLSLAGSLGCGAQPAAEPTGAAHPAATAAGEHAHPDHGPHGGELIELGNEEYHAELIHDTASVTVYLLDSHASAAVPIDAGELTINLKRAGKPAQFKLTSAPEPGDPSGKSSKFVSAEAELIPLLDAPDAAPQLVVIIEGTSYRGSLSHTHDHEHGHTH